MLGAYDLMWGLRVENQIELPGGSLMCRLTFIYDERLRGETEGAEWEKHFAWRDNQRASHASQQSKGIVDGRHINGELSKTKTGC